MKTTKMLTILVVALVVMLSLLVTGNATAADTLIIAAPTVESIETEQIVPFYRESFDEPAAAPNHPPIDQIPAMPMPEPDEDALASWGSPKTILVHDALTGKTIELPSAMSTQSLEGFGGGYNGADGATGGEGGDVGILGFNNMSIINNTEQFPWRMNCKLVMHFVDQLGNDRWFQGSGSMIDAETVLTAAHCVYARMPSNFVIFDWAREIFVYPGWDGVGPLNAPPPTTVNNYGFGRGTQFMAGTGYINDGDFDRDCGLIRLNRGVGMLTGWFGWRWGDSCSSIQDRIYYNASFPVEGCGGGLHTGTNM